MALSKKVSQIDPSIAISISLDFWHWMPITLARKYISQSGVVSNSNIFHYNFRGRRLKRETNVQCHHIGSSLTLIFFHNRSHFGNLTNFGIFFERQKKIYLFTTPPFMVFENQQKISPKKVDFSAKIHIVNKQLTKIINKQL